MTGVFPPFVSGNTIKQTGTDGFGVLASYRYMVTPRSALEVNYQYAQNFNHYVASFNTVDVHTRMQEVSGAYVYNFNYKKYNPFLEGGVGGYIFSPILDGTTTLDAKRTTNIGALYGGGVAYELSPSFDLRAEYRGIIVKAPSFGSSQYSTGKYYNIYGVSLGVAYHF